MPLGSLLRRLVVHEGDDSPLTKAERRVAVLATHDIVPWAEQCLYAVGRSLSDYSRDPSRREMVDEAVVAADTLQVLLAELRRRVT